MKFQDYIFVFDLDNTIIQTDCANNSSYMEAIREVLNLELSFEPKKRFTRKDLFIEFPLLSNDNYQKIIEIKEYIYSKYIPETILNEELVNLLKILYYGGNRTTLLTESRSHRAKQLLEYYSISDFFMDKYYYENYAEMSKYQSLILSNAVNIANIVLFENDLDEIERAIKFGINRNQIIRIKI